MNIINIINWSLWAIGGDYWVLEDRELEGLSDTGSYILSINGFFEERDQEEQLLIVGLISHERLNGNTIVQVKGKRHDGVVNNDDVFFFTVNKNIQVFDEVVT